MIKISKLNLRPDIKFKFVSSPGPGGQNVNKVATSVLLRFDVLNAVSLPDDIRSRLLALNKHKLTRKGELIIKASRFRTQERNKKDALDRLIELIKGAAISPKQRKKTKPSRTSIQQRLNNKKILARKKSLRQKRLDE